jgi:hypothetical protein
MEGGMVTSVAALGATLVFLHMVNKIYTFTAAPHFGPDATVFERMGGETVLTRVVDRFYTEMASRDDMKDIADMFKDEEGQRRQKLADYLSGEFGGPEPYLSSEFKPPRMLRILLLAQPHHPIPFSSLAIQSAGPSA